MVTIRKDEGFCGQKSIILPVEVKKKCNQHPLTRSLYITDIGYYPKAQYHYRERLKGIDQYILIYCLEGEGQVMMNSQTMSVKPNEYVVIPAGKQHIYYADKKNPWSIYWLHLEGALASQYSSLLTRKESQLISFCGYSEKRNSQFDKLFNTLESGFTIENLILVSINLATYLSTFFFYRKFINESTEQSLSREGVVDWAIAYMKKKLDKSIQLSDVANEVNLSIPHFSYVFKNATGYSPIQYYNHLKIQQSCEYLQYTNLRINEIANKIGIADAYYFSRIFAKTMGISPSKFRRKYR